MYNIFDLTSENNFLGLFGWIRIETDFPLESPFLLSKFSQSYLAIAFGSFINVNKEVSSAKSFGFD